MTLATMQNNILRFCPALSSDIIASTIQDSYRQLGMLEWNRLNLIRSITTVAPYSTGTVTIDSTGLVTGLGTTFLATMVGRQMRVYYQDSFFEILTVPASTQLTLRNWTGEVISLAQPYTIFGLIYSVDTAMKVISDVAYQTSLDKKDQGFFNRRDPERSTTGTPTWWAYAGYNALGYPNIEIYPVADAIYPLRVYGKAATTTLTTGDTPFLPEDLLEAHALLNCYRIKDTLDPKGGWAARVTAQGDFYKSLFDAARDEDFQLGSRRIKVKDYMGTNENFPPSDSFWSSHDVE